MICIKVFKKIISYCIHYTNYYHYMFVIVFIISKCPRRGEVFNIGQNCHLPRCLDNYNYNFLKLDKIYLYDLIFHAQNINLKIIQII